MTTNNDTPELPPRERELPYIGDDRVTRHITVHGPGRCTECSFHVATQGHRDGCSTTAPLEPQPKTAKQRAAELMAEADVGKPRIAPWEGDVQAEYDKLLEVQQLWRKQQTRRKGGGATYSSAYIDKAVRDELDILRAAPDGRRNHQLNISALKLGTLPGIDRDWLRDHLADAMHTNGYIRTDGIGAVNATIDSAFAKADKDGPRVVI